MTAVAARAPHGEAARAPARPLRVTLLAPCYWPEVRRGAERFARELASGLLERGHLPRLITSHRGRPSTTVEDGLEVVRNWRPPSRRLERRRFEDHLTHVPLSYASLVRGDADVAQAHYPTDALAATRWAQRTGRPAVLAYLGLTNRQYLASRRMRLEITLAAIEGSAAVTVLSEAARDALHKWLGVEARVIPPGVDLERFAPGGERAPSPTIFCPAAIDHPMKRVELLVEAFGQVRRERGDARLVLSLPDDDALARRLRREPGITLIDIDARPDELPELYRSAWTTALPSRGEAFGLVLCESMACGTPVVGTDEGALRELVEGSGAGRLCAPDDRDDLARALLKAIDLAHDPRAAAAARARAADYSAERFAGAYESLYLELTGRAG